MNEKPSPQGIGGWLILPLIGLFLTIIGSVVILLTTHAPLFSDGTWEVLTTPGSEAYSPYWAPALSIEILYNLCMSAFGAVILFFFFKKHYLTPRLMVAFYLLNLAFTLFGIFMMEQIASLPLEGRQESIKDITGAAIACAIWIPYFLKSERVKNTFVEGRREQNAFLRQA